MKKLRTCLAVVFMGFVVNSYGYIPFNTFNTYSQYAWGSSKSKVCVPSFCGLFSFSIAGLYWRPAVESLDYALLFNNVDFLNQPLTSSGSQFFIVNPNYNWGIRASVDYRIPCTAYDVGLTYTDYDHDFADSIGNPAGFAAFMTLASGAGAANNLGFNRIINLDFPANAFVLTLDNPKVPVDILGGETEFSYQSFDLEFGQTLNVGCDIRFRWYAGLRYIQLEHQLSANYTGLESLILMNTPLLTDAILVTFNSKLLVNQKSDYKGTGPRFGMNAYYDLGVGFALIGEISSAMLIGKIDSSIKESFDRSITAIITPGPSPSPTVTESASFSQENFFSLNNPSLTRIVPNVEGKLAISYKYQFCNRCNTKLSMELGWMGTQYWNCAERFSSVIFMSPHRRTHHSIDVGFEGPYAALQVHI